MARSRPGALRVPAPQPYSAGRGFPQAPRRQERRFGMGGGFEKAGNIATCAEVAVDRKAGEVKVLRVVSAFECGAIVNPDNLRNQIEGSNIMGLGGALFEAI